MVNKSEIKFEQPSQVLMVINQYLWVLLVSIMLVVLLLGYFFILSRSISDIKKSQDDTAVVVNKQKEVDDLVKKVTDLNVRYEAIQKQRAGDLRRLQQIVPSEPQIAELFVIAERLAVARGFILSSIDIANANEASDNAGQPEYPAGLKTLMLNMSVSKTIDLDDPPAVDSYTAFKQYLDDLERSLRLFDVKTVTFSGVGIPGATSLSFGFTITTYYSSSEEIISSSGLKSGEGNSGGSNKIELPVR